MKIFQIGFNRCGTTSLHQRFEQLGLRSVHHGSGELALTLQANLDTGKYLLAGYEGFDAFTDMESLTAHQHIQIYKRTETILEHVPDAVFILNKRNKEHWIGSCAARPDVVERMKACHNYETDEQVIEHWSEEWDAHHAHVRATVPAERLLVFDIDRDDARKLDAFLGIKSSLPPKLGRANPTPGRLLSFVENTTPYWLGRQVPKNWRRKLRLWLRARR